MSTSNYMHVRPLVLVALLAACGSEDDGGLLVADAPSQGSQSAMFDWTIRRADCNAREN